MLGFIQTLKNENFKYKMELINGTDVRLISNDISYEIGFIYQNNGGFAVTFYCDDLSEFSDEISFSIVHKDQIIKSFLYKEVTECITVCNLNSPVKRTIILGEFDKQNLILEKLESIERNQHGIPFNKKEVLKMINSCSTIQKDTK